MADGGLRAEAVSIGPVASRVVNPGRKGRIGAVFSSVFYVDFDGDMIAVANQNVPQGPLNVTTNATTDWLKIGLKVGKTVHLFNGLMVVPGQVTLDLTLCEPWLPRTEIRSLPDVTRAINRFDSAIVLPPQIGYGRCTITPHIAPVEIKGAWHWIISQSTDTPANPIELVSLLGRGPGLTPAGDDVLGGMMIALHYIGQAALAQTLWTTLAPHASQRTNAISDALLAAASQGFGNAPLHDAVHALFDPATKNLPKALAPLDQIGHSSGWDAFAGFVLVMRAEIAASAKVAA